MGLTPSFFVVAAMLLAFAAVFNQVLLYRVKMRLLRDGLVDKDTAANLLRSGGLLRESLKWGLVFLCGGLGLMLVSFLPERLLSPEFAYGLEAAFVGLGFVVYFILARRLDQKNIKK